MLHIVCSRIWTSVDNYAQCLSTARSKHNMQLVQHELLGARARNNERILRNMRLQQLV